MNKKHLSVVMAGAMLATTVAPVLAETVSSETTQGKLGLLVDRLDTLLESKKYDVNDKNVTGSAVTNLAGKTVYRIEILKDGKETISGGETTIIGNESKKTFSDTNALKALATNFGDAKFYTVNVYELGNVTDANGRILSVDVNGKEEVKYKEYTKETLAKLAADVDLVNSGKQATNFPGLNTAKTNGWVTKVENVKDEKGEVKEVIITLGSKNEAGEFNTIKAAVGTKEYIFVQPVDKNNNLINGLDNDYIQANIAGFNADKLSSTPADQKVDISAKRAKKVETIKVANGDVNYTAKVNDLYDGFMLTEQGHQLINKIREYKNDDNAKTDVQVSGIASVGTERSFTVTFTTENGTKHVVKVVGDSANLGKITTLKTWLSAGKANVELLAGSNRYATAVEIAKTYLASTSQYHNTNSMELVLVNGGALVDGLAAAPYARAKNAQILLTAEDKLPKETKEFMKELIASNQIGQLKNITVTIVGGEAVVSNSVVKELKEIGFKVKRLAGDNREQTSLAVADKLTSNKAYLVGAEGEADAMSIAAHAASEKSPIIVSKSAKGLSTMGLNEVSDYANVEIIGGEKSVPKATEEALKELVANKDNVTRLNGKNRFETNALVIKEHHSNFANVLVAKDGQRNKTELVDALPAAIFASSTKDATAPIVLATDKISEDQLNQLVLKANKKGETVYQIGNGVARSVMEKIVSRLGLNN
ncbi:cell wall-binding repeat-containing protein [Peptacetobacter sp.]|uniref:cell wall-binding repeat-containing protein n=1 Tax=Peptacetobacter sp. TaxID=2991975 RepID=UPI00262359C6|nr:cell wall-binding repeat-containing protein [Peptacetobacter sp.]